LASTKTGKRSTSAAKNKKNTGSEDTNYSAIIAVICLIVAVFLELSNFGIFGTVGEALKKVQFGLFGWAGYLFPILVIFLSLYSLIAKKADKIKVIFSIVLFLMISTLIHLASGISLSKKVTEYFTDGADAGIGGGFIGGALAAGMYYTISRAGAYILVIVLIILCIFLMFRKQFTGFISDLIHGADDDYDYEEDRRPVRETAKPVRSAGTARRAYEEDDIPDRNVKRSSSREKTVYETKDGETVVRIVKTTAKRTHMKKANLTRTKKQSAPLREGAFVSDRLDNKVKGVGNTAIVESNAGGDELHEITKVKTKVKKQPEKTNVTFNTTIEDKPIPEPKRISEVSGFTDVQTSGSDVPFNDTKTAAEKTNERSVSSAPRASLSGTTFSQGEAVRTFEPVHQVKGIEEEFQLPPTSLLTKGKGGQAGTDDVKEIARDLIEVLSNFGVNVELTDIQVGPSVTRFELKPEMGTRVSKITSLQDDLKLNLAVSEMRIEAPIPGKAAIGIEIPNKARQTVMLRELIESPEIQKQKSKIAFSAGKDISGNVIACDLAKMPHMLVAGTTGSGKSVFLNSIILCILYRATPREVGLIIVDPKKVEFGVYQGIPHLMKPVVTDPGQAVSTLRWAVGEMTNRYQRMQMSGVRDFKTYNEKFDAGTLSKEEENPKKMQQIVIVIDELADLMMVAAKEVESLICRLAQLARAAGIHLIIATQRPSVDVVTGLIKANIPARVALLVASGVDSRNIIDMVGAEKLLGYGDMLFYPTGYVKPVRVQGAFVSDEEIQRTVKFLTRQSHINYFEKEQADMDKFNQPESSGQSGSDESDDGSGKYDEYLYEAGKLCIESGKASSSMLQRRFSVGFNRAARIIDQLYEIGAIGPQNGAKPREILVDSIRFEELCQEIGII